ncbi:hypothetical protein [Methylobacterium nigriterrae]|uniref:hypothetical protein n=1 Tax=Methylobacterium nigriterrae TaxID=3127512 RepID=UPI003013A623
MKLATLACATVLSLLAAGPRLADAAQPTPQPGAAAPKATLATPAPAAAQPAAQPSAQPAARAAAPQPKAAERRRRNSYASCNRISHQRGLRGGARRRFLIRCRLGYERNRQPPAAQPAAPPAPAQQPAAPPVRRP